MANTLTLNINEKSVVLKFGYGLFRLLGEKWGLPGINSVMARFAAFKDLANGGELTFELMEIISDLVMTSVRYNDASVELDPDEICDYFLQNVNDLGLIMELLASSLPQDEAKNEAMGKKKQATPKK
jgi:hypothetical protein